MIKGIIFDMYDTTVPLRGYGSYNAKDMAIEANIDVDIFYRELNNYESYLSTGKMEMKDLLRDLGTDEKKIPLLVNKRLEYKKEGFFHLHEEMIPTLKALKEKGIKIGLLSNCEKEEAIAIKGSIVYPYYDAAVLSYDEGLEKPDPVFYQKCLDKLSLEAKECIYIGDGDNHELESAKELGFNVFQAHWYIEKREDYLQKIKKDFLPVYRPFDLLDLLEEKK